MNSEVIRNWEVEFANMMSQIGPYFARAEPRQRAGNYIRALLSDIRRKNGWQIAEQMGEKRPDGVQRLLSTAMWQATEVKEELWPYVAKNLSGDDGILIVDETGFLKKGHKSVGVKRQYSGTAGRVENCQVGVFAAYASEKGHTLVDQELYLPKEWAADSGRREEAGVPAKAHFATKPELAETMLTRLLNSDLIVRWVTGDSLYGSGRQLRLRLEARQQPFLFGIRCNEPLWQGLKQSRADRLVQTLTDDDWQSLSAGAGAKGPRIYEWALISLPRFQQDPAWQHALLARRSLDEAQEIAYFVVFAPLAATLQEMVHVAGRRWAIEECFQIAKDQLGLDEYEVRHWQGWYRHTTLVMWAQAFLATIRVRSNRVEKKWTATDPVDSGRNSSSFLLVNP
jgi:SRSO17 transposase